MSMFTPEFVDRAQEEFILVATHILSDIETAELSVDFNLARIRFGYSQLPESFQRCRLIYDLRGQNISTPIENVLQAGYKNQCILELKTH